MHDIAQLGLPTLQNLSQAYRDASLTTSDCIKNLLQHIKNTDRPEIWITRVDDSALLARAAECDLLLKQEGASVFDRYPLFGIPFAVKDNIDAAGLPTTAACPAFSYVPEHSSTVVKLLVEAGAILIGKTNLDQFATGLVGVRSPYGAVRNAVAPEYVSGGSSSGSGASVALGLVAFSLGTDTAG